MTSVPPQPQQVAYVTQSYIVNAASNAGAEKYAKVFLKLGVIQIILSILSIIFGIALVAYTTSNTYDWYEYAYDAYAQFCSGIWGGAFFFTSGILGVESGRKKTRCLVTASLVMTIFSALAAAGMFFVELIGALVASPRIYDYPWTDQHSDEWSVVTGLHSFLCVLAAMEFVVAIIHSGYCCGANCCGQNSRAAATAPAPSYAYVNPMPGQVTVIPGQQATFIQGPAISGAVNLQPYQQPVIMTSVAAQPPVVYQMQPVPQNFAAPQQAQTQAQQQPESEQPPNYHMEDEKSQNP